MQVMANLELNPKKPASQFSIFNSLKKCSIYILPSFPNYLFLPKPTTLLFPILMKLLYQKFPEL